mgnify:CR=1 FL=1
MTPEQMMQAQLMMRQQSMLNSGPTRAAMLQSVTGGPQQSNTAGGGLASAGDSLAKAIMYKQDEQRRKAKQMEMETKMRELRNG